MPVELKSPARKGTPGGNSTFDLFSWYDGSDRTQPSPARVSAINDSNAFASVNDPQAATGSPVGRPTIRMHQPAGGVSSITFGDQITAEEAEALLKSFRRPGSEVKRREMNGSGIFSADSADGIEAGNGSYVPSVRLSHQPAGGASQISFGGEDAVSPKKPTSIPEVAKQRELCGNFEHQLEIHRGRQHSNSKAKELVGSNIFGPPPEDTPRSVNRNLDSREDAKASGADAQLRNVHTSVRVSNPAGGKSQISFGAEPTEQSAKKVHDQKLAELSGSNIFKDETPSYTLEKALSTAKLKEMSGSDIFADERPPPRDSIGGIRKPPDKTSEGFYSRPPAKQTSERKYQEMKGQEISTVFDQSRNTTRENPIPTSRKATGTSVSTAKLKEMMGSGIFPDQASVWQNCITRNTA